MTSTTKLNLSAVIGAALIATLPMSGYAAQWSNTDLVFMSGSGYKDVATGNKFDQEIFTLEHVSGWEYGDNFFFVDVSSPNSATSSYYAEFSPRLSFGKISGKDLSFGIIKDVLLASTWEMGQNTNAKLFGLGFDLNIPGVPVASINVYNRYSESKFVPGKTGSAPQITLVWNKPFSIGSTNWVFEGFLDYAWEEKDIGKKANLVAQPRLWLDAGALWGTPKKVYAGVEQSIWNNKYGVDGKDENVTQFSMKYVF